jgi:Dor1-like family
MLEVNRTSWFSVVTQFNALFQDSAQTIGAAHPPSSILSAWITRQTQKLLNDLQSLLPDIEDGASLRAVLEQALFFASRLGQVGCDFSGLLMPLFCKIITDRLSDEWESATGHFKIMINNERFVLESEEYSREQVIPLYLRQDLNEADDQASASPMPVRRSGNEDVPAPSSLLAFPPLAYLLNSFLSGFNLLRECPVLRLRDEILEKLSSVLEECCMYLIQHSESIASRGAKYLSDKSKGKISDSGMKLNEMYAMKVMNEFIPHVLACFEHVFPSQKVVGKKGKAVAIKFSDPTSSASLNTLKENLSPDLCDVFQFCLGIFTNAKLINVSGPDVSDSLSKLKSTVGDVQGPPL